MTPENAMRYTRLHPRCGTNYLFLVMAVSILFFAALPYSENFLLRFATRIVFLPLVAGLSYEVLKLAAASDGWLARAVRAPGLGAAVSDDARAGPFDARGGAGGV